MALPTLPPPFFSRLRERKLVQWAFAYVAAAWFALEFLGFLQDNFFWPPVIVRSVTVLVVAGFFIVLVLAWYHGEKGRQRVGGSELLILAALLAAAGMAVSMVGGGTGEQVSEVPTASESPEPGARVVVLPFENGTGDPDLDMLGRTLAYEITRGLTWTDDVGAVAVELVEQASRARGDGADPRSLARDLGAASLITGRIWLRGDSLEIQAEIVLLATGEATQPVVGRSPRSAPMAAVAEVRDRVVVAISATIDSASIPHRWLIGSVPRYDSYQEYLRAVEKQFAMDEAGALAHYYEAYRLDTTFVSALLGAAGRHANLGQRRQQDSVLRIVRARWDELTPEEQLWAEYFESQVVGDADGALRVARDAFARDKDNIWGYILATHAIGRGRPELAATTLEALDFDDPRMSWPPIWERPGDAYHALKRFHEERAAARRGRDRFPESLRLLHGEIRARIGLGELDELDPLLLAVEDLQPGYSWDAGRVLRRAAAELARHDHPIDAQRVAERALAWYGSEGPGLNSLGQTRALLLASRPREALELLRAVEAAHSDDVATRGLYAIALARSGDEASAEAEARWLKGLDRPYLRGRNTYLRAAVSASLGRADEAVGLLRKAFREGQSVSDCHHDFAFSLLWGYEPFEELLRPKG